MQDRIIMSGIGGQGIVVGTKLIGIAATNLGRYCMHYAIYGGEMRGTKCECTLTVSDAPVTSTPEVSACEAVIIMHPESFDRLQAMLVPGGLALVNSSLIHPEMDRLRDDVEWLFLPVTDIGTEKGHLMVATMVAIGAFAEETQIVPSEAIKDYLTEVIPAYRHQLLEMDRAGVDAGAACLATGDRLTRRPAVTATYLFKDRQPVGAVPA